MDNLMEEQMILFERLKAIKDDWVETSIEGLDKRADLEQGLVENLKTAIYHTLKRRKNYVNIFKRTRGESI